MTFDFSTPVDQPESVCLQVLSQTEVTPEVPTTGGESLLELVLKAADLARELISPCLTGHGLNDARFTIMRAIRNSASGECSQSELARRLDQSEANISTLLDRMRGDGLVTREKSPCDRRRSVVRITERGQDLLSRAERDYGTRAEEAFRAFDVFEIQAFRTQLESLTAVWDLELEQSETVSAVAGRIGEVSNDSTSDNTVTRHAQAG